MNKKIVLQIEPQLLAGQTAVTNLLLASEGMKVALSLPSLLLQNFALNREFGEARPEDCFKVGGTIRSVLWSAFVEARVVVFRITPFRLQNRTLLKCGIEFRKTRKVFCEHELHYTSDGSLVNECCTAFPANA